jgi:hypothetical protein
MTEDVELSVKEILRSQEGAKYLFGTHTKLPTQLTLQYLKKFVRVKEETREALTVKCDAMRWRIKITPAYEREKILGEKYLIRLASRELTLKEFSKLLEPYQLELAMREMLGDKK